MTWLFLKIGARPADKQYDSGGFVTTIEHISAALDEHEEWLGSLRAAMAMGGTDLHLADIYDDHQCVFGRWLRRREVDEETRRSQFFSACVELHRRLHLTAGDVVALVIAGRAYPSPDLIEAAQTFRQVSHLFTRALHAWHHSAAHPTEVFEPVTVM